MNGILLDTNIILDIALERDKFVNDATRLLQFIGKNDIKAFVTATTVTDIYYVTKKKAGHDKTINFLTKLFEYIKIAGVETVTVLNALNSGLKDFEDAIQTEAAKLNNIEIMITRNKNDFDHSGLEIFTPDEYLNQF